jgi:hypothetical protein
MKGKLKTPPASDDDSEDDDSDWEGIDVDW